MSCKVYKVSGSQRPLTWSCLSTCLAERKISYAQIEEHFPALEQTNTLHETVFGSLGVAGGEENHVTHFDALLFIMPDSFRLSKHKQTHKHNTNTKQPAVARNIVNNCGQERARPDWKMENVHGAMAHSALAVHLLGGLRKWRFQNDFNESILSQFHPISVCICRSFVAQC